MAKKIIQVPVDEELLQALDHVSNKLHKARAAVIRQACKQYLRQMEQEELDKLYQQGYEKAPEEHEWGEAQINLATQILSKESW
ncbi:MAG: ribbon-helix-helix protein, CopG family [Dehalococcoidia bacterium]|jgi:metal-responsive CopG/Arc/MetJ family transcriptional regulator|nr:ribbon-helix-helix protein, CopG family [Dehalococcoidia bacterium]